MCYTGQFVHDDETNTKTEYGSGLRFCITYNIFGLTPLATPSLAGAQLGSCRDQHVVAIKSFFLLLSLANVCGQSSCMSAFGACCCTCHILSVTVHTHTRIHRHTHTHTYRKHSPRACSIINVADCSCTAF